MNTSGLLQRLTYLHHLLCKRPELFMIPCNGAGNVCFSDDHALPDTSMRLSDYVLQTFLVNIFSLAIAIIFPFQDGKRKFQNGRQIHMFIRVESDKRRHMQI